MDETLNTYNKIAKKYDEEYGNDLSDAPYIDLFLSYIKGNKILDIGCGPGTLSKYIADKGYKVDAIDYSEEMIKIAKNKVKNVDFFQMDMRNITIEKKYNGIMLAYSLFHISKQDVRESLLKYHDILEDDGIMLIILQEGIGEEFVKENLNTELKKFINYYSFDEIEQVLNDRNFKVIEKNRKKPISAMSMQNDKLILICKKINKKTNINKE